MSKRRNRVTGGQQGLEKCPTGIQGLDEITGGGLPRGRTTLVCGGPGCGKSLFGVEFLVRGATLLGEPGALITFEESAEEITQNVASLGFDLNNLVERKLLSMDYVHVERSEIEEAGEYDLEGLFIRLGMAIDAVGAKRVVLDTIETLFSGLSNTSILRAELRRLFRWLKERGVTAVITGERGEGTLTRHGLEEYVSDCVIMLDHRVEQQVSTRRLRVIKYRGSSHGSNEYPFLIDDDGVSVLPITSLGLNHEASTERISTGVERLDRMLGGKGYYRGSSILISGTAGTGKSSLSAHFADSVCRGGERCMYFAFEESESQISRNMRSIGIDLQRHVKRGLLEFHNARPTAIGLEMHLATMHKRIAAFKPVALVVDPITNLIATGDARDVNIMLTRLVDFLKTHTITAVFTSLTHDGGPIESSDVRMSSLMDTWLLVRSIEVGGERNRILHVLKSRGMAHSNQVREFLLTDHGVELVDVYTGPEGVLTGSARKSQEARERAGQRARHDEIQRKQRFLERKRRSLDAQIAAMRSGFEEEEEELARAIAEEQARDVQLVVEHQEMAQIRKADETPPARKKR